MNLTNTKWVFNENISLGFFNGRVQINFISNNKEYIFLLDENPDFAYVDTNDDYTYTYDDYVGWENQAYRTITITGGADVENPDLIAFLQANATQITITDLTNTTWVFNETINISPYVQVNISFVSGEETFEKINVYEEDGYLSYDKSESEEVIAYQVEWQNPSYRTIKITGGDVTNLSLMAWLITNATQPKISNLTGTKWVFNEIVNEAPSGSSMNDDGLKCTFVSKGVNYTSIGTDELSAGNLYYWLNEDENIYACENNVWSNQAYRTIEITGGEDVETAEAIVWLQQNATLIPQNFNETKTALKIYEDLTQTEYEGLEKDNNAFYQVNEVGVYKGTKLIAMANNLKSPLPYFEKDHEVNTLYAAIPQVTKKEFDYSDAQMRYYIYTNENLDSEEYITINVEQMNCAKLWVEVDFIAKRPVTINLPPHCILMNSLSENQSIESVEGRIIFGADDNKITLYPSENTASYVLNMIFVNGVAYIGQYLNFDV